MKTIDDVSKQLDAIDIVKWFAWETHKKPTPLSENTKHAVSKTLCYFQNLSKSGASVEDVQSTAAGIDAEKWVKRVQASPYRKGFAVTSAVETLLMYIYDICAGYSDGDEWVSY